MNAQVRPRRLLVTGGSRLSEDAALLWHELGRRLAVAKGLIIISGGLARRVDSPDRKPADLAVIEGVLEGLRGTGIAPEERIETVLPDRDKDWSKLQRFREGRVLVLQQRTPQARRFRMVYSADVVVSIEGEKGTRSVLDVALAIERPILPLPFGGGESARFWRDHIQEIRRWFAISEQTAEQFEKARLDDMDPVAIADLAALVYACVEQGFTRNCFVIMPFDKEKDPVYEAICGVLAACGLEPFRTDRRVLTGNVIAAIRDGLRNCFLAIADTTDDRPNVMYELGMAHASDKPVILLRRATEDGALPQAPFDIQTESIIGYTDDMDDLRRRLGDVVRAVCGGAVSRDDTARRAL